MMESSRASLMDEIARRSLADERARYARAAAALDPADPAAVVAEANRHRDRIDEIITALGARLARRRRPSPP